MIYISNYNSPLGNIKIASKNNKIIEVRLKNQKDTLTKLNDEITIKETPEIILVKEWLTSYFNKENPSITNLPIEPIGNEFRKTVWSHLKNIPYGKTTTYKEIAKKTAKTLNKNTMSAQAVGNAIGNNPIAIIIPCHRVVGTNNTLTGYDGGLDKKIFLLSHEEIDITNYK